MRYPLLELIHNEIDHLRIEQIRLRKDDDLLFCGKLVPEPFELITDDPIVLLYVVEAIEIDEMQEDPGPLDMLEEAVSQAFPAACSFDESGDILDNEASSFMIHDPEIRDNRREGV